MPDPSNARTRPHKRASDSVLCQKLHLVPSVVCATREGSGKTV